jgi:hypothetical protein
LWTAAQATRVWPHGLCFTNELYGNTADGYLHVSDSNYDWGQGLKDLERWRRQHANAPLTVWYFGTDPALAHPGFTAIAPAAVHVQSPNEFLSQMRGKVLAVSTTNLYGGYTADCEAARSVLRALQPRDRTPTFLIYDFRGDITVTVGPSLKYR